MSAGSFGCNVFGGSIAGLKGLAARNSEFEFTRISAREPRTAHSRKRCSRSPNGTCEPCKRALVRRERQSRRKAKKSRPARKQARLAASFRAHAPAPLVQRDPCPNELSAEVAPRRVLTMSATTEPQFLDSSLASHGPRRHVIELQESPRATAPPVLRAERASSAVPQVHLASHLCRDVTRTLRWHSAPHGVRVVQAIHGGRARCASASQTARLPQNPRLVYLLLLRGAVRFGSAGAARGS